MSGRRKFCRAVACPRHVDNGELFCQVHWRQLTPTLRSPIAGNIEATKSSQPDAFRKIADGTAAAVAVLAKKEGRAGVLAVAERVARPDPGQGGAGDQPTSAQATSAQRDGGRYETGKLFLP